MASRRRSSSAKRISRPGGEALALGLRPSAERLTARTGNPLAGQETASLALDTAALVEQGEIRIETRRLLDCHSQ